MRSQAYRVLLTPLACVRAGDAERGNEENQHVIPVCL